MPRQNRRVPLDMYCNKMVNGVPFLARARDISRDGLYLHRLIEPKSPQQAHIAVEFCLPGTEEVIWADDETYDQWEWLLTLEGELAKGEINGTVDFKSIDGYGSPDVSCLYQSRMNYKAVKLTTEGKPDRPTGTDGGGIQNQAEIPSVEDEE